MLWNVYAYQPQQSLSFTSTLAANECRSGELLLLLVEDGVERRRAKLSYHDRSLKPSHYNRTGIVAAATPLLLAIATTALGGVEIIYLRGAADAARAAVRFIDITYMESKREKEEQA